MNERISEFENIGYKLNCGDIIRIGRFKFKVRGIHRIENSKKIEDVNALDYDLLVFIWWGWAERQYHDNEKYLELAKSWNAVAAICIAPTILSYSWLFNWKEVTGRDNWEKTQIKQIEMNWWIFKYEEVVQDWKIITANWPEAATKFARKIVDFLKNLEN